MSLSDQQQLYQQIILDHGKARHGATSAPLPPLDDLVIESTEGRVAESHQINPTCGDETTVRVTIGEADAIDDVVWWGDGCTISMAAASVLSDTVRGTSVVEARALVGEYRAMLQSRGTAEPDEERLGDAAAFVGVSRYPARVKCAMLAWVAFEQALLTAEPR